MVPSDINFWLLVIAVFFLIYLIVKGWHMRNSSIHQDRCDLCNSKKVVRVKRDKIFKLIPFTSKKYRCKSCNKNYLIIHLFSKRLIVSNIA